MQSFTEKLFAIKGKQIENAVVTSTTTDGDAKAIIIYFTDGTKIGL